MTDRNSRSADKPLTVITGAAGAIGSALCRVLAEEYFTVGLDQVASEDADASYECDLTSDDSVEETLAEIHAQHGEHIASVIHLAAYFDFSGEDHPLYQTLNVEGSARLLHGLQSFDVEQFVFSSTMLVHAPVRPGEQIDENSPLGPRWVYPASKYHAEQAIREARGKIPVVLLRLAGLYDEQTAIPTLAQQIARIYERSPKSHLYSGSLDVGQAVVHKEDMIDAFRAALARRAELTDVTEVLIGEPQPPSYGELQEALGDLIHGEPHWATARVPKTLARAGAWTEETLEPAIPDAIDQGQKPFIRPFMVEMADDHYALDISRAHELLNWQPQHRLQETLPDLVASLKRDPLGWYEANGVVAPAWLQSADAVTEGPETLRSEHEREFRQTHARFLWAHFFTAALGCWLMVAPAVLGYSSAVMLWSDQIAGAAIVVLGLLALSWRLAPVRWVTGLVGVWLLLAPLLFWAPDAAAYLNGMLVGAATIALATASRPPPGTSPVAARTGPGIPDGWTVSPSSWLQRIPIIALAFVGLFCSMYMTSYQLGYIDHAWDPFFGDASATGTERVIGSDISEAFPVPDAGLGAVVYLLEILLGIIGSTQRWRTMPWVVAAFGVLIVPLGIVSITFIVIQPIIIGSWCALCLLAAAAMLLQIAYSANELVATGQFLQRRWQAGEPLLRTFFRGDTDTGGRPARADDFERPAGAVVRDMISEGVSLPWSLAASAAVGVWLMFTRVSVGAEGTAADLDHLIGALAIAAAVIACGEVARPVRYVNMLLGLVLAAGSLIIWPAVPVMLSSVLCGVLLTVLALPRGPVHGRYGRWERMIV